MPRTRTFVGRASRFVPLDGGIPIAMSGTGGGTTPATGGTGVLFGSSVSSGITAYTAEQVKAGPWSVARDYNPGGFKTSWAADAGGADVGVRASVWSAKPDMTSIASGAMDTTIQAFIASIPDSHTAFVDIWHEPDVKTRNGSLPVDLATFNAAKLRFYELVKEVAKPHVFTTLILSSWSMIGKVSKGLPDDFWVGPSGASRVIDVVGWDVYMQTNTIDTAGAELDACVAWANTHGAAWAIGELGLLSGVTDLTNGATWLSNIATYATSHGAGPHSTAAYVCLFDSTVGGVIATPSGGAALETASAAFCNAGYLPYTKFVL